MLQGARENIPGGSSTDEQRSSSTKDRQPGGCFLEAVWRRCSSVTGRFGQAVLSRALRASLQKTARPFPIYEMGSNFQAFRTKAIANSTSEPNMNRTMMPPNEGQ